MKYIRGAYEKVKHDKIFGDFSINLDYAMLYKNSK